MQFVASSTATRKRGNLVRGVGQRGIIRIVSGFESVNSAVI
jgi:hypothetical protein